MTDENEEFTDEDLSNFLQYLLEIGAIEMTGFDAKSNQFMYNITPKAKDLVPEFYYEHFRFVNELAFKLWQDGHIEMKFDKNGTPMVILKDLEYTKNIKDSLPDEERFFLENLMEKYIRDTKQG